MIVLEQRVCPHPEVVDTELDGGEMVLLHLESKTYHSLNLTGMRIWQGVKEELTLKEVSRRLQEEFEVDADRADRSVLALVTELCQQRLVQGVD
ncbi:MAG TPA: PqqD family protein [Patescibacteria group bacterium]|nr:PqqD family protein [Patescibacteria group bacterium]